MTQLLIDGTAAILPWNFSCTVKRENSFFTKSGEFTYDATLRLDNPVNQQLWGWLSRINKSDAVETRRSAVLIADGHVYCRGTEVVTRWTEETVSIQIVSGESEMNYFIGQDLKMEELDLGEVESDDECAYPVIRTAAMSYINVERTYVAPDSYHAHYENTWKKDVPSPMLCTLLERIIRALGYTIGRNQLAESEFKYLFIVNKIRTRKYASMIAGWTVKDFLEEVEKLTGVVFVTDSIHKTCDILLKTRYYQEAQQYVLRNVVDAYEAELVDSDSQEADFPSSNVSYDLPDHRYAKLMRLPEGLPTLEVKEYASLDQLLRYAWYGIDITDYNNIDAMEKKSLEPVILKDTSTGRQYIRMFRKMLIGVLHIQYYIWGVWLMEVDQMADLKRGDTAPTLELKITPAPMVHFHQAGAGMELIDLGGDDGYFEFRDRAVNPDEQQQDGADEEETEEEGEEDAAIEDIIRQSEVKEKSAGDLYCAFYDGQMWAGFPVVYTDRYHCQVAGQIAYYDGSAHGPYLPGLPTGSLRLRDLDESHYQGGYKIDTGQAVTFETYDPNVIDPRQVYVICNRRFVVRDVEETITAMGRQPRWKLTCYPLDVSDTALLKRWVLTKGTWDDGGAWLDDGRWYDDQGQAKNNGQGSELQGN